MFVSRRRFNELQEHVYCLSTNNARLADANADLIDQLHEAREALADLRGAVTAKLDALQSLSASISTAVERVREQCLPVEEKQVERLEEKGNQPPQKPELPPAPERPKATTMTLGNNPKLTYTDSP
jgi:predicted  nucleic acid-binding Zn-ribbon protein